MSASIPRREVPGFNAGTTFGQPQKAAGYRRSIAAAPAKSVQVMRSLQFGGGFLGRTPRNEEVHLAADHFVDHEPLPGEGGDRETEFLRRNRK